MTAPERVLLLATASAGQSSPILYASNPVGGALLSTGVMTLAGATAAAMVPVLPVRMSGIDVSETLHRFAVTALMAAESDPGTIAANRIGEPLATLTMRWLVAPDGFEATPSAVPPDTELDAEASQRFVMHDGALRFHDRGGSGMRFFGAGRTYPTHVNGTRRLLFAAAAVVVEGRGTLKNLRGSVTMVGELAARSLMSLTLSCRFDGDGPYVTAQRLTPIEDAAAGGSGDIDATLMTLVGESAAGFDEQVHAARVDSDLTHGAHPRGLFACGGAVGRISGPLPFDLAERRCAVALTAARRELTFCDDTGAISATLVAERFEGTALKGTQGGPESARIVAYAPVSEATGMLSGTAGLLTLDTVLAEGRSSSLYTIWLVDPDGRFRAASAVATLASADPKPSSEIVPPAVAIDARDPILPRIDQTLAAGSAMLAWFRDKEEAGDYLERFDVPGDATLTESFGFFDVADAGAGTVPVMGVVRELFYDREREESVAAVRDQLRAFVLRYLLRVTGGYQQIYAGRRGEIHAFPSEAQHAIVDMRDVGPVYDWIAIRSRAETFDVPFAPFGRDTPRLEVSVHTPPYLVVGPAFIVDTSEPRKGVVGEYGFGYAMVPSGPIHAAVQTVRFKALASGEIRVRAALIVNRPERIAAFDLDPIAWSMQLADLMTFRMASRLAAPMLAWTDRLPLRASGVDPVTASIWMANALTGGEAEKRFGISKAMLEKRMLLQQFRQHEAMLRQSLQVWRMVPDWTTEDQLPDYCRKGIS